MVGPVIDIESADHQLFTTTSTTAAASVTILVTSADPAYVQGEEEEDENIDVIQDGVEQNGDCCSNENIGEEEEEYKPTRGPVTRRQLGRGQKRGKRRRAAKTTLTTNAASTTTRWSECQYCGKAVRAPFIHVFRDSSVTEECNIPFE